MFDKVKQSVQETIALLTSRAGLLLAIAAVGFIIGSLLHEQVGWWLLWVCVFAAFDVYVYPTTALDSSYRIGQGLFWVLLSYALYKSGARTGLYGAWFFWLFFGCDALYLWSRRLPLTPVGYFDVNPFVLVYKYTLKKDAAPVAAMRASIAIGTVVALILLLTFH